MKTWHLYEGGDDKEVELVDIPAWAAFVSRAAEFIDVVSGHSLCGGGPTWAQKVPVGLPRYLEVEGQQYLDNSLGELIYDAFAWAFWLADRRKRSLVRISVSSEVANSLKGEL